MNRRSFISQIPAIGFLTSWMVDSSCAGTYVVRKGDTLSEIAQRFGTSVRTLKQSNRLRSDIIRVGQKLTVSSVGSQVAEVRRSTARIRVNKKKWKYIVVHHSATPYGNAKAYDRVDRSEGMKNGLAYHFVIGNGRDSRDGQIEIGRRWTKQLHGGHVSRWEYNNHGIGICLVGNFEKQRPTRKQMDSLKSLIRYLGDDLLGGRYDFLVHKEINPTLCPGRNFPTREMHRMFG
ncbi:MAG: N-acetylmuramoyl-L-alanine amidase [Verrucomicrobiales bacterium]|nr:N-acetylmuramoyl-L-alanine amidase [Verrucomicrobiota bacterium JB025]